MDALLRVTIACGLILSLGTSHESQGASFETPNFVVQAPTAEFAQQVGEAAEYYRRELSIEWTGQEMPRWFAKCPIQVQVGQMGAGGETTFNFENGEVFGWKMRIQGNEERILDSVLPHEINHTIFACHFRRPLPRWADEGAASIIEHESERNRLRKLHHEVLGTSHKIPLRRLLEMKEYPKGQHQVLTLYAEGHSLADYLIARSDKATFLKFLQFAHQHNWDLALKRFYNYPQIEALEKEWDAWVIAGSRPPQSASGVMLADNEESSPVVRGQNPETLVVLGEASSKPIPLKNVPSAMIAGPLSRDRLQHPVAVRPAKSLRNSDATPRSTMRQSNATRSDAD